MPHVFDDLFAWTLRTSAYTTVVILLVLAVQTLLGRRLAARWRYALWAIVIARALAPALPQSAWSVFNLANAVMPTRAAATDVDPSPAMIVRLEVGKEMPDAPVVAPRPMPVRGGLLSIPALAWLAGCALFASFTLFSAIAFARRLRHAKPQADRRVARILDECRETVGLRNAPVILAVGGIHGPALTGIFRPRIVVPPGLLERLDDDELRFVLTHELTHLRRRDLVGEWLLVVMRTVHWFNPLVWYAVARCRADRELACDEQVMRLTSGDSERRSYGHTILKLAEGLPRAGTFTAGAAAVGILEGRSQLKRRLLMIARFDRLGRRCCPAALVSVIALALASCTLTDRKPPAATTEGHVHQRASADDASIEIRIFNVRDLVETVPLEARKSRLAELAKAVKTVLPAAPTAEVATDERADCLVVTSSPAGHVRVQKLLDECRTASTRRQVLLQMQFVAVDDVTMAVLKPALPAVFAGGDPAPGETRTVQLDPAAAAELLQLAKPHGGRVIAAPSLLVNEGEGGSLLIGGEAPYVQGFNLLKGKDGKEAYEPTIRTASFGLTLDVTATADADATQTSIRLESRISTLVGMKEKPFGKTASGDPLVVEEPNITRSEVKAAETVPAGQTLLVRGLRGSPEWMQLKEGDAAAVEDNKDRDVLLLIKAGVITPTKPPSGGS